MAEGLGLVARVKRKIDVWPAPSDHLPLDLVVRVHVVRARDGAARHRDTVTRGDRHRRVERGEVDRQPVRCDRKGIDHLVLCHIQVQPQQETVEPGIPGHGERHITPARQACLSPEVQILEGLGIGDQVSNGETFDAQSGVKGLPVALEHALHVAGRQP